MTELWMAIATVGYEEGHKGSNAFNICAIDYGTTITSAAHQPRSSKNGEVRRKSVVWTADRVCKRPGSKAVRFGAHQ
jgi:hypothetical protein